ncbi:hypothetical protein AUJ62_02335 [Candidatus Pacearchaeota archaeon CG1_02_32_21]|nr:MAG: hypothetical protein AUJ62_02335 [Candidatus Pacearchaeota archaeon CG1_02_32_21]
MTINLINSERLSDDKVLHATIFNDGHLECPRIDQFMLRLTAIRNRKIWFSYDFVTHELLNRDQSLDSQRWHYTVNRFSLLSKQP